MVDEQLARRGVTDARVLDVMRRIPRHRVVEEGLTHGAYEDHPLPIGEGQTISQPYIVALMTALLELTGQEKALEVGTGSGYQTAVLGALARRVCSIERLPRLAERARATLETLGVANVWIRVGNGALGWPDEAPFDRILVAAGGPSVPPPLVEQLVQGVGYRDYAQRHAERLGLVGYVMNLKDGRVQARAEGPREVIEEFVRALEKGPPLSQVSTVNVRWMTSTGRFAGFDVRFAGFE